MPELDDVELEDDLGEADLVPYQYAITSYGADYPVDGLVKRLQQEAILIPSFQRRFVWKLPQSSRFIESLLLGLPVPGIFLAKEEETQKLLVIDGQQRLLSLKFFYDGLFADSGREFQLKDVQPQFEGRTYRSLDDADRLRLDDSIIHATIIRQDQPSEDDSSVYHVFERLNTGGTPLYPQEIRACLYHGPFSALLGALNADPAWRSIAGRPSPRLKDQELILRFLALYYEGAGYRSPMKAFLNAFMGRHRSLKAFSAASATKVFAQTIGTIHRGIGDDAFKPKVSLNAAVFDAVMVGVGRRLAKGPLTDLAALKDRYSGLLKHATFKAAYEKATADVENVKARLGLATDAFAPIA